MKQEKNAIVVLLNEDDWLTPVEAAKLMKNGKGITTDSFMNRIYDDRLPKGSYVKTPTGWKINKAKLTGFLKRTNHSIAA